MVVPLLGVIAYAFDTAALDFTGVMLFALIALVYGE